MKKLFCLFCIMFTTIGFAMSEDIVSERFISALSSCSSYSESGIVQTEGLDVSSSKKILGKENNKCIYQEEIIIDKNKFKITCKFSKAQTDELTGVMKSYAESQKYSNEKVDTSSLDVIKTNPVSASWANYLQNPDVCSVEY